MEDDEESNMVSLAASGEEPSASGGESSLTMPTSSAMRVAADFSARYVAPSTAA